MLGQRGELAQLSQHAVELMQQQAVTAVWYGADPERVRQVRWQRCGLSADGGEHRCEGVLWQAEGPGSTGPVGLGVSSR